MSDLEEPVAKKPRRYNFNSGVQQNVKLISCAPEHVLKFLSDQLILRSNPARTAISFCLGAKLDINNFINEIIMSIVECNPEKNPACQSKASVRQFIAAVESLCPKNFILFKPIHLQKSIGTFQLYSKENLSSSKVQSMFYIFTKILEHKSLKLDDSFITFMQEEFDIHLWFQIFYLKTVPAHEKKSGFDRLEILFDMCFRKCLSKELISKIINKRNNDGTSILFKVISSDNGVSPHGYCNYYYSIVLGLNEFMATMTNKEMKVLKTLDGKQFTKYKRFYGLEKFPKNK